MMSVEAPSDVPRALGSRLLFSYVTALGVIALLSIVATAIFWRALAQHSADARLINLAGRQRMLSQRISKIALELNLAPGARNPGLVDDLRQSIAEWGGAQSALERGEAGRDLPFPKSSGLSDQLHAIEPKFESILTAAKRLLEGDDSQARDRILAEEGSYLRKMDRIVSTVEQESSERVDNLKRMQAAFTIVLFCLLALIGAFQFRPLQRRVRRDMGLIEHAHRELREKNALLSKQSVELREVSRLKSEFLANVSHELRTPLSGIIGFSELLRDGKPGPINERQSRYIGNILSSSRHLLHLINNLLDLARVEAGKMEVVPEPVETAAIILEIVNNLQPAASPKRIRFEIEVAPETEQCTLDPHLFRQILYNYISNAVRFSPAGATIVTRLQAKPQGGIRLEVEDKGPGIELRDVQRLFQRFEQLGTGSQIGQGSTGLGLALVKRIAETQGGHAGVESEPGRGSLFFVEIPHQQTRQPV